MNSLAASYEELIFDIQRYGNTAEKREAKAIAREELFSRRADGLRAMMEKIHTENVMIGVIAQEMVEQFKPEETAPVLADFLTSEYERTRKVAAFFMGLQQTPEYADKVMPLLGDEEAAGAAMRTLGKWKSKEAVTAIIPFLAHPREVRRIAAANALRDIGDPTAIPYLIEALNDPFYTVRETSARAITTFGNQVEPALLQELVRARDPARRYIVRILGDLRTQSAMRPLQSLLKSDDEVVREDVREALGKIGDL